MSPLPVTSSFRFFVSRFVLQMSNIFQIPQIMTRYLGFEMQNVLELWKYIFETCLDSPFIYAYEHFDVVHSAESRCF